MLQRFKCYDSLISEKYLIFYKTHVEDYHYMFTPDSSDDKYIELFKRTLEDLVDRANPEFSDIYGLFDEIKPSITIRETVTGV